MDGTSSTSQSVQGVDSFQHSFTPRSQPGTGQPAQQIDSDNATLLPSAFKSQFAPPYPQRPVSSQAGHLPTPQSPTNFDHYIVGGHNTPESPLSIPLPSNSVGGHSHIRPIGTLPRSTQHIITPESSPYVPRTLRNEPIIDLTPTTPTPVSLPSFSINFAPLPPRTPTQSSTPTFQSQLSSPFMAKQLTVPNPALSAAPASRPRSISPVEVTSDAMSMDVESAFFLSNSSLVQPITVTNDASPSPPLTGFSPHDLSMPPSTTRQAEASATKSSGGELERIRQQMAQEQLTQVHDLESRRPDYLKRIKRTFSEAGLNEPSSTFSTGLGSALMGPFTSTDEDDRWGAVGITDSPTKGRRLKLFQETSEESFEESLMAGGYGRYRTAEWVRQPQPVPLALATPLTNAMGSSSMAMNRMNQNGPSEIINLLDAEATNSRLSEPSAPPTEKELRKRRRLAAFTSSERVNYNPPSRLYAVELEGRGRVLLDMSNEMLAESLSPAAMLIGGKKRPGVPPGPGSSTAAAPGSRRKKKLEPPAKDRRALGSGSGLISPIGEEMVGDRPNWPDSEFPWRLRTQEMREAQQAEEQERLKCISKFLDRESDDEDADDESSDEKEEEEILPSAKWGMVYDDGVEKPVPSRRGRGKMVPLRGDPSNYERQSRLRSRPYPRRSAYFPSDPADARAALMAKRSVRDLSYRQQRRARAEDDDGEILCICQGRDDGRQLVQCDGCKTWYHLQCIGLKLSQLGNEEDPWFCHTCAPQPVTVLYDDEAEHRQTRDPIFAPNGEIPDIRRGDVHLFHPQDSPLRGPTTPKRGSNQFDYDFESGFGLDLSSPSHGHPRTPLLYGSRMPHIYSTPGRGDGYTPFLGSAYDDAFDPSSSPSRGMKLSSTGPFATPTSSLWPGRGSRSFGAPGFLSSILDDSPRMPSFDDSPIRHQEVPKPRRIMDPPSKALDFNMTQDDSIISDQTSN